MAHAKKAAKVAKTKRPFTNIGFESVEERELIRRAAKLQKRSLNSYMVLAAVRQAMKDLQLELPVGESE